MDMETEELPPQPIYDEAGVDISLVRWMLSLTPAERLTTLEDFSNAMLEIRERNGIQ
jgi:hypothetical protein